MRLLFRLALPALVSIMLVAACTPAGSPRWTVPPSGTPPTAASPSPSGAVPSPSGAVPSPSGAAPGGILGTLEVRAFDIGYEPKALTVEAAGRYEIVLVNDGVIAHDITLPDGGHIHAEGGQTARGEVDVPAGGLEFICSIVGHADAGMTGTITVGHGGHVEPTPSLSAEQLRDLDAARTALFPAATAGKGNVVLEPVIGADGVKQWELTATEFEWEIEPGVFVDAMGYNGMVPGPQLRAEIGDRVRVILHNELSQPTTIHFHGLTVPANMDGVPVISQPAVMPGESFTYEFELRNSGSHMYHSHFMAAHQVPGGLLGAFVVSDPAIDPVVDVDYTMVLNDGPLGYTLNGKSFPATEPISATLGQTVRVRYMNEGLQIHPMHLHGIAQQIIARDGHMLDQPYFQDTVLVAPGERVDVLIQATEPGVWAFHCHVLTHAERDDGMFGMVTALIVGE